MNHSAKDVRKASSVSSSASANDSAAGATVLLVEDESFVREVTREILHGAGYRVLESSSATDAKLLIGSLAMPVQLLLTDVVLPDQSGLDLAADLKSQYPRMKVVFISGYPENAVTSRGPARHFLSPKAVLFRRFDRDYSQGYGRGCRSTSTKPQSETRLACRIMLQAWGLHAQSQPETNEWKGWRVAAADSLCRLRCALSNG